jgi:hypothetical protein
MTRLILPLALGTVLAGAAAAFATESTYTSVHHHLTRAQAHARKLQHEGLSRNPSDCVKYGCLGY